jgi:heat shock protein HtpX
MGLLTGLFLMIGNAIGGTGGMVIAFMFAIAMNMGAWWFSDSMALRMSGAKEADEADYPDLHRMTEELSARADIPKPRVYVIETDMPNAFATGRSPQKGAVAFTTGIMAMLNRDELAGVLAHELAHIKNRDTLISSIAATMGGAITMLADMAMWGMIFGGFSGDDEDDGLGSMAGGLVMMIVAPIAAMLIQMAISRAREFTADATGAQIAQDPMALASALEKIEAYARGGHTQTQLNPATSHMYIIPPMRGGLARLFSTHPDTAERIARLQAMQDQRVAV